MPKPKWHKAEDGQTYMAGSQKLGYVEKYGYWYGWAAPAASWKPFQLVYTGSSMREAKKAVEAAVGKALEEASHA